MKTASPAAGIPSAIRSGQGKTGPRTNAEILQALAASPLNEWQRKLVAEAIGFQTLDAVPEAFEDGLAGALWWMKFQKALAGDQVAFAEIMDRLAPKPRRMEVSGPDGAPLRAAITALPADASEREQARSYYEALAGPRPAIGAGEEG